MLLCVKFNSALLTVVQSGSYALLSDQLHYTEWTLVSVRFPFVLIRSFSFDPCSVKFLCIHSNSALLTLVQSVSYLFVSVQFHSHEVTLV